MRYEEFSGEKEPNFDFVKFGKFEVLNPSENQNLKSLTLTPNLDFDKKFMIFVTKILKFEEKFCEIDQILYISKTTFWDP